MAMQAAGPVMADINVTPLVDVMLVLLIIFMVAAPVMEKQRSQKELDENRDKQQRLVALNLPALDNSGAVADQAKSITLKVSSDLVVSLENNIIADCSEKKDTLEKREWTPCLDEIERAVRDNDAAREGGVIVDAEPNAKFGFIVGVMHRLHKASIEKVSMFPRNAT